jgi:hypothetical protein
MMGWETLASGPSPFVSAEDPQPLAPTSGTTRERK